MNNWSPNPGQEANRRRSQRVLLSVPITVSGEAAQGAFSEETQTLVVNAHGALMTLQAKLSQGQALQIKSASSEMQTCRVVYIGPLVGGRTQFGVEFTQPAPHFWHITFPGENWSGTASDELAETKKK